METPPSISRIAAQAFTARQAAARKVVAANQMSRVEAERRLAPWLAIACLAGADLPELGTEICDQVTRLTDESWTLTEWEARGLVALRICDRSRWAPLLAAARDAAIRRADSFAQSDRARPEDREAALAQARALIALAQALRLDPNGRHDVPLYQHKEAA